MSSEENINNSSKKEVNNEIWNLVEQEYKKEFNKKLNNGEGILSLIDFLKEHYKPEKLNG